MEEAAPEPTRVHLSDQARRTSSPNDDWDADRKTLLNMPVPKMNAPAGTYEPAQSSDMQQPERLSPHAPFMLDGYDPASANPYANSQSEAEPERNPNAGGGHARSQADDAPAARKPVALQGGVSTKVSKFGTPQDMREVEEQDAHMFRLYSGSPPPYPDPKMVNPPLYSSWLKKTHPELGALEKSAIVEIKGQWDDSGHILHYFGLPSTRLNGNQAVRFDFSRSSVAIVDCAGNLSQETIDALRSFVAGGGYLVSTDWALDNFLVKAFPGALEWNGGYSYPDMVDAIVVEPNPDLIKGCVPQARWKLDDKCQTVKVRRPEYVHVLVRSPMLCRQDPDGRGVLAATFQYGKGQVLHVVGHFDINSTGTFTNSLPDPAPRIGIGLRQAIIANFIAAALNAHSPAQSKTASSDSPSARDHPGEQTGAPAR
jgi:hypothetical protein